MAYTKTVWQERIAEDNNRFIASGAVTGEIFLANKPANVTQAGTPFSVENMNKMEQGISDAHQGIADILDSQPFGYTIPFRFMPSELQLATWRCLSLQGQVVLISQYKRLCNAMYVGDENNAAADWWYKTSDEAGAVRDPSGAYMRIADGRGMFERGAGANSLYRMASDAPYDGLGIGAFGRDNIQSHAHYAFSYFSDPGFGADSHAYAKINGDNLLYETVFTGSYGGSETAPAWIAVYVCIRY
jgi:hypothetical protein